MSRTKTPSPPLHFQFVALGLVFLGGALGAGVRGLLSYSSSPTRSIVAVFVVNIVGSFLLGFLLEWLARKGNDDGWRRRVRLFLGTGFCGALTTYSTFSMDILHIGGMPGPWNGSDLVAGGIVMSVFLALVYSVGSVIIGVASALFGIAVASGSAMKPMRVFEPERQSMGTFVADPDAGFLADDSPESGDGVKGTSLPTKPSGGLFTTSETKPFSSGDES